jgi:serine/threonine protein kinase
LLAYDPEERISAEDALKHPYFRDMIEMEQMKDFQTTFSQIKSSPSGHQKQSTVLFFYPHRY